MNGVYAYTCESSKLRNNSGSEFWVEARVKVTIAALLKDDKKESSSWQRISKPERVNNSDETFQTKNERRFQYNWHSHVSIKFPSVENTDTPLALHKDDKKNISAKNLNTQNAPATQTRLFKQKSEQRFQYNQHSHVCVDKIPFSRKQIHRWIEEKEIDYCPVSK